VCCCLQVAPPGERYGGNRRPGRKQRQTTAELSKWRDSLHVTCGLTACTPGSAPGPTLGNEYGNFTFYFFLLTGNVIRRMRSGRVRIFYGNQWETLSLITQDPIGVRGSNLVGIIDVGVVVYLKCGILSRSVGQTNRNRNMADIQNIKCNNQRKASPNRRNFPL